MCISFVECCELFVDSTWYERTLFTQFHIRLYIYISVYNTNYNNNISLCHHQLINYGVAHEKYPGLSFTSSRSWINNKRTANVTLRFKSCCVVIKECQSPGIPAARWATVITWLGLLLLKPGISPYPWARLLFRELLCKYRRAWV